MKIKYVIHPGEVKSKTDGDFHHISAEQLMELYKVDPSECIVAGKNPPSRAGQRLTELTDVRHLYPKYSGNYNL